MTIQQRVQVAAMHIFFRPFTVMEILAACNKTQPQLQVVQVLKALRWMQIHGKLVQRALGIYEWVK
jgi:hypothetical protein